MSNDNNEITKEMVEAVENADLQEVQVIREIEVVIKESEVIKLNAQPGDVLFFKFKGNDFHNDDVQRLGERLRKIFPNNKCIVMTLPDGHDVELTSVREEVTIPEEPVKDCSQPTSYCNNCNCGKKERIESGQE